jgi:hypothetical protein
MVQARVDCSELSFEQVIEKIFVTRKITRTDQKRFMSVLLAKTEITDFERSQLDRVFSALRAGLIKAAD